MAVRQNIILIAITLVFLSSTSLANECTDSCDEQFAQDPNKLLFCGTDMSSHLMPFSASNCYQTCLVSLIYPGECGCPNSCYESLGQGYCWSDNSTIGCSCNGGWGGPDCTTTLCPDNTCQQSGVCQNSTCQCDSTNTAFDCSVSKMNFTILPYGQMFPSEQTYVNDKYNDSHPVFNLNVIANLHISISEENLMYMLAVENAYNASYVNVSFSFDNGVIQQSYETVGMKLRGATSRRFPKKSYTIKFSEEKFFGMKKLVLKSPGTAFIKNQIVGEFYRAMNLPTSRSSWAMVWVNGINYGIYWIAEALDDVFLKSRFGDDNGNMYKGGFKSFWNYRGSDPQIYANCTYAQRGALHPCFDQTEGNGNYTDFADFVIAINELTNETIEAELPKWFSVDSFIRSMVIETAISNMDCYPAAGNNWQLFHNMDTGIWEYISFDFDDSFGETEQIPLYEKFANPLSILPMKMLAVPVWRELYTKYFYMFMKQIYNTELLTRRINEFEAFLLPLATRDQFTRVLTYGQPVSTVFQQEVEEMLKWIPERNVYILANLEPEVVPKKSSDKDSPNSFIIIGTALTIVTSIIALVALGVLYYRHKKRIYSYATF